MKITCYRDPDNNIHAVTDESPKGFKGVLYVGHGPDGTEQVYAANVLQKWERIDEPKPEPEPTTKYVPQEVQLEFAPWRDIPYLDVTDPASLIEFVLWCAIVFIVIRPFFFF